MAIRKIRKFRDPMLRKKSREVAEVDDHIREILDDMLETLHSLPHGGALAAPQIGVLKRLVVIDLEDNLYKLVNPVIVSAKGEQYETEGCLSFPDIWGKVRRPKTVTVEALNEFGEKITVKGKGLMAKCFCHEIDHLDGIVFIDKAEEFID